MYIDVKIRERNSLQHEPVSAQNLMAINILYHNNNVGGIATILMKLFPLHFVKPSYGTKILRTYMSVLQISVTLC